MITVIKKTIAFLMAVMVVYWAASFIAWDQNPGNWTRDGRLITALIMVVIGSFSALFAEMEF